MNHKTDSNETAVQGNASDPMDEGGSMSEPVTPKKETKAHEPKADAGTILKNARQQQGLSLEIVHEATKIPLDALRAIEEGYTVRTLSPFYYSGFVKMYANYLHVDVSEVIDDYKPEELPEAVEPDIEEFDVPRWMTNTFSRERLQLIAVVAGAVLALFLIFKFIGFLFFRKPQPPVKQGIVKKEVVKKEVKKETKKEVKKEVKKVTEKPRQEMRRQTPQVVVPQAAPKAVQPIPKPAPKPVPPAVPVKAATKDISLAVRANQNSWLRVKTDGIVVFQSTLRAGAVEMWIADQEIEISGRNINQLEFELNGKMIGTLGRKDRNANKVVITKDGLSVKQ